MLSGDIARAQASHRLDVPAQRPSGRTHRAIAIARVQTGVEGAWAGVSSNTINDQL